MIEPPADMRQAATTLHQMLMAYTQAGFTRDEAFKLCVDLARQANGQGRE